MSHDKQHDALHKATKTLAAVAVAGTLTVGTNLVKDSSSPAFGITAEAAELKSGTTTENLNLRKGAGTGNAVIKVLPKGTKLEILSSKDGWLEVKALGSKGWVSALYVNQGAGTTAKQTTHTVVKGDTLYSVSKKYGVTVAQLQQWNNLKGTTIKIGQKLAVSSATTTTAPTQATTHTVVKGDTLYSVSRKYGVTVAQLQQWNNLKGTTIRIGQKLLLSGATAPVATVKADSSAIIEAFKNQAGDFWQVEVDEANQVLNVYFTAPVGLPSFEPVANKLLGALEQLNDEKGTNFNLELRGQKEAGGKLLLSITDGKITYAS